MKLVISRITWLLSLFPLPLLAADVVGKNDNRRAYGGDRSWGNPADWLKKSTVVPASGNALVQAWPDISQVPVGHTEVDEANKVYFDEGASLIVVEGGRRENKVVVLGVWADSEKVEVTGGTPQSRRKSLRPRWIRQHPANLRGACCGGLALDQKRHGGQADHRRHGQIHRPGKQLGQDQLLDQPQADRGERGCSRGFGPGRYDQFSRRRDPHFGCPVKIAIFRRTSFEALCPPDVVA